MKRVGKDEIIIGGRLLAMLLQEFLGKIGSTGAKVGGHDGEEFGAETAEQLQEVLDENRHLFLVADKFDGLEGFCVQHGIPFDRHGDAGEVRFRPGMKCPASPDEGSEALLDAGNIRPVAVELARLVIAGPTRNKLLAAATKVIRRLNGLLPPEIEPLPPLEIEE